MLLYGGYFIGCICFHLITSVLFALMCYKSKMLLKNKYKILCFIKKCLLFQRKNKSKIVSFSSRHIQLNNTVFMELTTFKLHLKITVRTNSIYTGILSW